MSVFLGSTFSLQREFVDVKNEHNMQILLLLKPEGSSALK